jgi:hypothetical protein
MNDISVLLRIRLLLLILGDVVVDTESPDRAREPGEHKLVRHKVACHHGKDRWDNDSSALL